MSDKLINSPRGEGYIGGTVTTLERAREVMPDVLSKLRHKAMVSVVKVAGDVLEQLRASAEGCDAAMAKILKEEMIEASRKSKSPRTKQRLQEILHKERMDILDRALGAAKDVIRMVPDEPDKCDPDEIDAELEQMGRESNESPDGRSA